MKTETSDIDRGPCFKRIFTFAIVLLSCLRATVLLWQPSGPAHGQTCTSFWGRNRSFSYGKSIPGRYTCDGANLSPQLQWQSAPAGTMSSAIVMDDPDAPSLFTHWLVYNIPPRCGNWQRVHPNRARCRRAEVASCTVAAHSAYGSSHEGYAAVPENPVPATRARVARHCPILVASAFPNSRDADRV